MRTLKDAALNTGESTTPQLSHPDMKCFHTPIGVATSAAMRAEGKKQEQRRIMGERKGENAWHATLESEARRKEPRKEGRKEGRESGTMNWQGVPGMAHGLAMGGPAALTKKD